jgi:hypothetical protein
MGAERPRSFSDVIAAKHAEFISYREAISKLADFTGDSPGHVATALKQEQLHTRHAACLSGAERAVHELKGSSQALSVLFDNTIRTGQIAAVLDYPWEGETADPDREGWMRAAFSFDLGAICELPCPDTLDVPSSGPATPITQPSADADVAGRLRAVEAERDRLALELAEQSSLLDATNTRIQELSSGQALGKSRTAMLQVIGGLVMANTDMDIHASRLDGLTKLRTDLETVGVIIGEDTLRSYLKDAAQLIEKPVGR